MKFNRLVLRGNMRVKKVKPPGAEFLAGPYTQFLPTIGVVGGSAPLSTDSDGYNTITAIIAAESGSTVTLPSDIIYEIDNPIQMPSGKTLEAADGTSVTIKRADGYSGNMIEFQGTTGSTLSNITLDGNYTENQSLEALFTAAGVFDNGSTDTIIQHCKFMNMPSYGVYAYGITNISIVYNEFDDCFHDIYLDGNSLTVDAGSITGNTFTHQALRSNQCIEITGATSPQIFHNTFTGAGLISPTSPGETGTWGNAIYIWNTTQFHVENNTCNQCYWSSFQANEGATNGTVKHNYFTQGTGTTVGAWVVNSGANNIVLTLNICDGTLSIGSGGGNNCIVTENIINSSANGIEANEGAVSIQITGNRINRTSGSGDGILLWNKNSPSVACLVTNNIITGFTSAAIGINNTGNTGTVFNITATGNTFTSNTANYSIPSGVSIHISCTLEGYQPAPAPTPAPAPDTSVLMTYYPAYDSTYDFDEAPLVYTHVVLFRLVPGTSGIDINNNGKGTATAGYFRFTDDWNVTQAQIQTVRARGQKVIVSIGGASNGYYFENTTEVNNFVASFQSFYASYGPFDGIDYNCYEAGIMPENASNAYVDTFATYVNQISTALRNLYGSSFIICTPPNPNSAADQRLVEAMDNAGLINFACPQYYDWTGFAATDFIKVRNRVWVDTVFDGDESKVVLGLPSNYTGGGGPTLAQSLSEWDKCVAEYPAMRGVFGWNMKQTLDNGDTFGQAFEAKLF